VRHHTCMLLLVRAYWYRFPKKVKCPAAGGLLAKSLHIAVDFAACCLLLLSDILDIAALPLNPDVDISIGLAARSLNFTSRPTLPARQLFLDPPYPCLGTTQRLSHCHTLHHSSLVMLDLKRHTRRGGPGAGRGQQGATWNSQLGSARGSIAHRGTLPLRGTISLDMKAKSPLNTAQNIGNSKPLRAGIAGDTPTQPPRPQKEAPHRSSPSSSFWPIYKSIWGHYGGESGGRAHRKTAARQQQEAAKGGGCRLVASPEPGWPLSSE
jgi:hypothetical protein